MFVFLFIKSHGCASFYQLDCGLAVNQSYYIDDFGDATGRELSEGKFHSHSMANFLSLLEGHNYYQGHGQRRWIARPQGLAWYGKNPENEWDYEEY